MESKTAADGIRFTRGRGSVTVWSMRRTTGFVLAILGGALLVVVLINVIARRTRSSNLPAPVIAQLGPIRTKPHASLNWQTAFLIAPDGSLWWWGEEAGSFNPTPQQLGTNTEWIDVAAGQEFGMALKSDGSLWQFGANRFTQPDKPLVSMKALPSLVLPGTRWRSVAAGANHVLAILVDGSLWAWGANWSGQLGRKLENPSPSYGQVGTETNWVSVAADWDTNIGVRSDGSLWVWGWKGWNKLTSTPIRATTPERIGTESDWANAVSSFSGVICKKRDGTLWRVTHRWYEIENVPIPGTYPIVTPLRIGVDFVAATDTAMNTYGLKSDSTLWMLDSAGNDNTNAPALKQVGRRSDWTMLIGSGWTPVGMTADGNVWEWGMVIGRPERKTQFTDQIRHWQHKLRFPVSGPVYEQATEPFVLMRFVTNTPPAAQSK